MQDAVRACERVESPHFVGALRILPVLLSPSSRRIPPLPPLQTIIHLLHLFDLCITPPGDRRSGREPATARRTISSSAPPSPDLEHSPRRGLPFIRLRAETPLPPRSSPPPGARPLAARLLPQPAPPALGKGQGNPLLLATPSARRPFTTPPLSPGRDLEKDKLPTITTTFFGYSICFVQYIHLSIPCQRRCPRAPFPPLVHNLPYFAPPASRPVLMVLLPVPSRLKNRGKYGGLMRDWRVRVRCCRNRSVAR
jgi:hypothetical protein